MSCARALENRIARFVEFADHRAWSYIERFDGNPEFVEELKDRIIRHGETLRYDKEVLCNV